MFHPESLFFANTVEVSGHRRLTKKEAKNLNAAVLAAHSRHPDAASEHTDTPAMLERVNLNTAPV